MVKERLKTILLLSLVCLSLFLTKQVWMQSPYRTSVAFEGEKTESTDYLCKDIIKPHKYLINFNEDSHTIFHSDTNNNLWTSAHSSLVSILSSDGVETENISNEEFITYNDNRSIVFYFPEPYNTYILARFLDVSQPNDITENIEEVNSVYFYLGKEEPYVVLSNEDYHIKVYESSLNLESVQDKVNKIEGKSDLIYYYPMRANFNIDNDIYIPYKMRKAIPTVYVKNEIDIEDIDELRSIAETFFQKDIDNIGEIVENNGSVIYLYEDMVLKINQDGFLEYYAPLDEQVLERNLYMSLVTASEFLSSNAYIPEELHLAKIEEIESGENLGYRFTFKYRIGGLPVLLKSNVVEDFVQLEVFNKHIRNYKRFIREEMNISNYSDLYLGDMLSAYEILSMNYDLIKLDYININNKQIEDEDLIKEEILSSIEDIYIAYLDPCENKTREKLIGVWVLKIENIIYAFDVYDGSLVIKKGQ